MCGIAGIYSYAKPVEPSLLERMSEQLIHRGPDADGFYLSENSGQGPYAGLAMRRLKVIDLESGNQPIHDGREKFWIVFNGEIYNYRELRADLEKKGHEFYTHSDTEVILHQYLEEGENCVKSLIGMFAFSIFNVQDKSLFIARDRLGVKPLFYHQAAEGVVFGSEIKALLEHPQVSRSLNLQAVNHYFSMSYLPSPWTPFEGVFQLPPGHWMKLSSSGKMETRQYWDVPLDENLDISEEEAVKEIERLLHQSMERRLIADVPIGTFLSGGLDSSALVWLMKEHKHGQIKTFCAGFDHANYDETPHARTVAKFFGTDHYEVKCGPQDVLHHLSRISWHADNLLADQAALPLYMVSGLAKKHVTVCLSGDGGDEVFIGYPTFHADRYHRGYSKLPGFIRENMIKPLVHALPKSVNKLSFDYKARKFIEAGDFESDKAHYWWRTVHSDDEKKSLFTDQMLNAGGSLDSYPLYGRHFDKAKNSEPVNRCLYADMKVWLEGNNLYKVDTMTMAHGLEARVPFLDHQLVEYMAKLPASVKFKGNRLKYLMKKVLKGKLPESILNRPKAGFHSPVSFWFRHALKDDLRKIFSQPLPVFDNLIKRSAVDSMLSEHANGKQNHAYRLWSLLVFRNWLQNIYNN